MRYVAERTGMSTTNVWYHVHKLLEDGRFVRDPGRRGWRPRNIQVVEVEYEVMSTKALLDQEFYNAFQMPTSGSAGAALLKLIYEKMSDMEDNQSYQALEHACNVLKEKDLNDAHPLLLSQITGAWDTLLDEWERKHGS